MSPSSSLRLALAATVFALAGCARSVIPLDDAGAHTVVPTQLRLIAPLSTATVTSRRPLLHWRLGAADDGAQIELCRDRACTQRLTTLDATGTSAATYTDLPTGVVYWRARGRSHGALDAATSPTWQFTVGARTAPVNTSWGTTLDVDGDGFADVAVGTVFGYDPSDRAFVYRGSASGLAATPTTTLVAPEAAYSAFGTSVASAGDVDGDGFADLLVSAVDPTDQTGHVYVYPGSASGLATTPAVTLAGPAHATVGFGAAVASAGDLDGDGYADVVVTETGSEGRVFVYLGSAHGLAMVTPTELMPAFVGLGLGRSVASAGDINGDGLADLAIGMPLSGGVAGHAFVYLGNAAGVAAMAPVDLTTADRTDGMFGESVACAGDMNGDGLADVVLARGGGASVYLGTPTGLATTPAITWSAPEDVSMAGAGDVNGDGFGDVILGRTSLGALLFLGGDRGLPTMPAISLADPSPPTAPGIPRSQFASPVASAGDVDGDGFADVVIGAIGQPAMPMEHQEGSPGHAYLYRGTPSGLAATPATTLDAPSASASQFGSALACVLDVVTSHGGALPSI